MELKLRVAEMAVRLRCDDADLYRLLHTVWSPLLAPDSPTDPCLQLTIQSRAGAHWLCLPDQAPEQAEDSGDLLYLVDKAIIIGLQQRRPELLYIHGAVLAAGEQAFLLAAPSGSGKSTTCWGLLHHGLRYLSDELAPIDLASGRVHAYPRALCLKSPPPLPYQLPASTLVTGHRLHVAPAHLPSPVVTAPLPLAALVFVAHDPQATRPSLTRLSPGEATAHLYPNLLNALCHPAAGLTAAAGLCTEYPCFSLTTARLDESCRLLLAGLPRERTVKPVLDGRSA
jgi:hypothetical protein